MGTGARNAPGNFFRGESAEGAQGQSDLSVTGQRGMTTGEDEAQPVVAVGITHCIARGIV